MLGWSVSAELFSLILLLIIMFNFYEKRWTISPSSRIYSVCLWLSLASIVLNLICVGTLAHPAIIPVWVNFILNSSYFLLVNLLSTTMAYYLFYLVLEHVYNRHCIWRATAVLFFLSGLFLLILVTNPFTKLIFTLDSQGVYHRGPVINLGYGIMGIQLFLVLVCAWRNRSTLSAPMLHIIRILPPMVVLITIYQIAFPQILLNGSLIVLADLLFLLNFQSRRIELDSLTCVNNRNSFFQELTLRLAGRQQFQILVISLRHFTFLNQHYGHPIGNSLLVRVATHLNGLHPQGQTFRLGNVEFALLLPYTNTDAAQHMLVQICRQFRQPWPVGSSQATLETYIVELIHTDQDWNATDAMEFLQYGLRVAAIRENHLVRFDESIYQELEQRRHILQLLHQAIQHKSFQTWYQPLYCCADGSFSSAEALLRLRDEDGHLVPTELLISVAEECGLLDEISWLLLDQVCALLGSGQVPQLRCISINLSMQQFMSDSLLTRVQDSLNRYHVPPHRLKIEITERILAQDLERVRLLMEQFSRMKVNFYLDDFGTGYSNLVAVLNLPFDCIKLDGKLIRDLETREPSKQMVYTVLQLFHGMGRQVVVEGVEHMEQASALRDLGADWLQGYYLSPPLPREELILFLQNPPTFEKSFSPFSCTEPAPPATK